MPAHGYMSCARGGQGIVRSTIDGSSYTIVHQWNRAPPPVAHAIRCAFYASSAMPTAMPEASEGCGNWNADRARYLARLPASARGFCMESIQKNNGTARALFGDERARGSNCVSGDAGLITLSHASKADVAGVRACLAQCAACARCRFVSFSLQSQECWWYASCTLRAVPWAVVMDEVVVKVKS